MEVLTARAVQNSQVFSMFDLKCQHFVQGKHEQNQSVFTHALTFIIKHYYSFKIFAHYCLVKTTRIIHHNQLLLTKY